MAGDGRRARRRRTGAGQGLRSEARPWHQPRVLGSNQGELLPPRHLQVRRPVLHGHTQRPDDAAAQRRGSPRRRCRPCRRSRAAETLAAALANVAARLAALFFFSENDCAGYLALSITLCRDMNCDMNLERFSLHWSTVMCTAELRVRMSVQGDSNKLRGAGTPFRSIHYRFLL